MRGAIVTVLVLIGLDVVLSAPASRVSTVLGRPSHWLAAWMDPRVPLIPQGHLDAAAAGKAAPGPDRSTNKPFKPPIPGHCPPGYLWAPDKQTCLRELA